MGDINAKLEKLVEKNKVAKVMAMISGKHESEEERLAAIDALGKCSGDEAFNGLVPLLHDEDAKIRAHAATALGNFGEARGRTFLSQQLEKEKDPEVIAAIDASLAKVRGIN